LGNSLRGRNPALEISNGVKTTNIKELSKEDNYMEKEPLSLREKFMREFGQMALK
jgi:hypothetical protein